jgi:hypothetical protein
MGASKCGMACESWQEREVSHWLSTAPELRPCRRDSVMPPEFVSSLASSGITTWAAAFRGLTFRHTKLR